MPSLPMPCQLLIGKAGWYLIFTLPLALGLPAMLLITELSQTKLHL